MKDLGPLHYFLGLNLHILLKVIFSQSKYIAIVLAYACHFNTRIFDTLIELNVKYTPSDDVSLSNSTMYITIVGNLVYLTITHSDIAYFVCVVSQFVVSLK